MSRIEVTTELIKERNTVRLWIPIELAAELGSSRLLPAIVTINDQPIHTTLHKMSSGYMMAVNKTVQQQIGATAGDTVHVTVEPDDVDRSLEVPEDLAAALIEAEARGAFDRLTPFRQSELVKSVTSAKKPETRARRISQAVQDLR